jgi:hypothetical protein
MQKFPILLQTKERLYSLEVKSRSRAIEVMEKVAVRNKEMRGKQLFRSQDP